MLMLLKKGFRLAVAILAMTALLSAGGCAAIKSALPKHTLLALLSVPEKLNPDKQGRSSPLIVYIFLLKKVDNFQQAQFIQIYNKPKKVLGSTLAGQKKLMILPGKKFINIKLKLPKGVTAIGLMAAYTDFINQKWRIIVPSDCDWGIVRVHVKFDDKGMHLDN